MTHRIPPRAIALAALALLAAGAAQGAPRACKLANGIQHVVYIQFDNLHIERDNPNVPSDLEQMPTLLDFMKSRGSFLLNHHTPLISHTADDIVTSLSGLYGDKHGQPVSNSFGWFDANGNVNFQSSFVYWTDLLGSTSVPVMVGQDGKTAPAPWVPWTRAGCDVGAVSIADLELENITSDINNIFGIDSPEWVEANDPNQKAQAAADFEGIAIHCGNGSANCNNTYSRDDRLTDELGGYDGYKALYGHKYTAAVISPNGPILDLNGNVIQDAQGHIGFPGFTPMYPWISLAYTATMLEAGVPVIYSYIADGHDGPAGQAQYGPGEAAYVQKLKDYDAAFAKFFARLAADGIDAGNTLFVITTEEQDHFAGTKDPAPSGCDGINVACTYNRSTNPPDSADIGEVNVNLSRLLATEKSNLTPFAVHSDMAPTWYITGKPGATDPVTRQLERDAAGLTTFNPYDNTTEALVDYIVDPVGMKMLHMVTGDASRTPTFVTYEKGDYFSFASGTSTCTQTNFVDCVNIQPAFAYSHGGYQPEITTLWLGLVGPGVKTGNIDNATWTDETDLRPTMLALTRMKDTYAQDGRVITEALLDSALPQSLRAKHGVWFQRLAAAYKQIDADVGALGLATLQASTQAVTGDDATYAACSAKIQSWTTQRDTLAAQMNALLQGAEFRKKSIDGNEASPLIAQADALIAGATCN